MADDPERLSGHMTGHGDRPGYLIVQGKTVAETKSIATKLMDNPTMVNELTNRIQYGRLILAKIPSAEAERRRRELAAMSRDRRGAGRDEAMAAMERRGVRPFVAELGEIEDRKEFASRDGGGRVALTGLDPREIKGEATA